MNVRRCFLEQGILESEPMPRISKWVKCGAYVVEVEVDYDYYPGRDDALYPTPETVRHMEELEKLAAAGDFEALKKAGRVYIRID